MEYPSINDREFDLLKKIVKNTAEGGGGGGGAVDSVNGQTGVVVLTAADVGAVGTNSPAFTGVPTAPTAAPGTNTTQIATMAAIQAAVSGIVQVIDGEAINFAALPAAASHNGENYLVRQGQGVYFVNRKPGGIYTSNGSIWELDGDSTEAYFQDTLAWSNLTSKPSTFAPSAHAATHVNGTDDIQNATASQKGLATAAQITKLDGIEPLADVTDAANVGAAIFGASDKPTPVDADTVGITDSAASNALKKLTWANIKATLKAYFDTIYAPIGGGGGGTKTYSVFTPLENQPPASNFATFDTRNSIAVLDFDDTTEESAVFVSILPEAADVSSGLIVRIKWAATTATTGNCRLGCAIMAMDATTDIDSDSFDTAAEATTAAPGTSGYTATTDITITTIDSLVAGVAYRLKIYRDTSDGADTMAGDAEIHSVEVRSAA